MYTLTQWSVEDYHLMIAQGILTDRSVELIAGDIINMSPEGSTHRFINHRGIKYLRHLLGDQAEVMEAHPITLSDSEPEPDIAIVRSPDTLYLDRHPFAEDVYWLIEISDRTLAKDLGIKKKIYGQAGIPEYWVIDVARRSLKVFKGLTEQEYAIEQEYQKGIIVPLAFPDVQISLERLLCLEMNH
jgi:Uma2 family endonuclease